MTWPTFATGDKITGADMADAKDYVDAAALAAATAAALPQNSRPRIVIVKNGTEGVPATTWARPVWSASASAEENNAGSAVFNFSMAGTERRVQIKKAGLYLLEYRWACNFNPAIATVGLMMSGANTALSLVAGTGSAPSGFGSGSAVGTQRCALNDYVGAELYNGSASAGSMSGSSASTPHQLVVTRLGD